MLREGSSWAICEYHWDLWNGACLYFMESQGGAQIRASTRGLYVQCTAFAGNISRLDWRPLGEYSGPTTTRGYHMMGRDRVDGSVAVWASMRSLCAPAGGVVVLAMTPGMWTALTAAYVVGAFLLVIQGVDLHFVGIAVAGPMVIPGSIPGFPTPIPAPTADYRQRFMVFWRTTALPLAAVCDLFDAAYGEIGGLRVEGRPSIDSDCSP